MNGTRTWSNGSLQIEVDVENGVVNFLKSSQSYEKVAAFLTRQGYELVSPIPEGF